MLLIYPCGADTLAQRLGTKKLLWQHLNTPPDFLISGPSPAPLMMPLQPGIRRFPDLSRQSFKGLPGMLADSLPDTFGNLLIDQWLVKQGRDTGSFSPIERLSYIGTRGMGALEFRPSLHGPRDTSVMVEIDALIQLVNQVLSQQNQLQKKISTDKLSQDVTDNSIAPINDIIRVGTSAGGARAKAVIAWNPSTGEIRSGQTQAPQGFEYWLMKFDGVVNNQDKAPASDPMGFGNIEYAYYLMAIDAGIEMTPCQLLKENERNHFMTQRFDRLPGGEKRHLQSLCAIGHLDFNLAGAYSYEQAMLTTQQLHLPHTDLLQLYKRMVFNIVGRNQDDHTKNTSFLMDKQGIWSLAPAYDVNYSYNKDGIWTSKHQMSANGKRENFVKSDLTDVAKRFNIANNKANNIISNILGIFKKWPEYADQAGVSLDWVSQIAENHRTDF